jgi:hypothetical protein
MSWERLNPQHWARLEQEPTEDRGGSPIRGRREGASTRDKVATLALCPPCFRPWHQSPDCNQARNGRGGGV